MQYAYLMFQFQSVQVISCLYRCLHVVMTQQGGFIEIQGSAEGAPFTREQSDNLLELAENGIGEIIKAQQVALGW